MTLLWLFVLLWLLGWVAAQVLVPAAIGWLLHFRSSNKIQPRHILLISAIPWLIPFMATLAMMFLAAAKSWGWLHDHCLSHAPHHPHFCFKHLPEMLLGHGHGHVVIASSIFIGLGILIARHCRGLRRQSRQLKALTALSSGRGLLRLVDDSRVMAFAAGVKQPRIYFSRGLIRQLSRRERRMVLAHESAHIRYRDLVSSRWLEFLLLLHIKPCAHLIRRLWRDAIETRADDHVARRFGRIETAELLLRLVKSTQPVPSLTAFDGGDPVTRIHELLREAPSTRVDKPVFEIIFAACLLALMTGLFAGHHTFETILGVLISL